MEKTNVETFVKAKKPIYKKWWLWAIVAVVLIGIIASANNGGSNETGTGDAEPQWEVIREFSGNLSDSEKEAFSEPFELKGGSVRIKYDIETTTQNSDVDSGTALIYILKEGTTKTADASGALSVAVQDVSTIGTKTGEEKTIQKEAGKYYIDINTSSVKNYKITIQQEVKK